MPVMKLSLFGVLLGQIRPHDFYRAVKILGTASTEQYPEGTPVIEKMIHPGRNMIVM